MAGSPSAPPWWLPPPQVCSSAQPASLRGRCCSSWSGSLPLVHVHSGLSSTEQAILWQIRLPRVVLGGLVGWMLAASGRRLPGRCSATRSPIRTCSGRPRGPGSGATIMIVYDIAATPDGRSTRSRSPPSLGAIAAVGGVLCGGHQPPIAATGSATILLAGIAVAAFFTAVQTYVQQQHSDSLREVYSWILGRLTTCGLARRRGWCCPTSRSAAPCSSPTVACSTCCASVTPRPPPSGSTPGRTRLRRGGRRHPGHGRRRRRQRADRLRGHHRAPHRPARRRAPATAGCCRCR